MPLTRPRPAIVLIGATGFTGRIVAASLLDSGTPVILAARDPDRLRALAARSPAGTAEVVDVTDRASLRRLLGPGDAVINTAGPFTELGEPVVHACIEAGAHYVDTTGEQPWMHQIYQRYDQAARSAGVTVVNAMAFEYALGDCALTLGARDLDAPLRAVDVVYSWGGSASSRGTRRTVIRMLGRAGWVRRDGHFHRQLPGAERRDVRLASGAELSAVAFQSGELVTAPRHLFVDTARGWLVVGRAAARAAPRIAPALVPVVRLLRPVLERLVTLTRDPTPEARQDSRFTIRVELEAMDGRQLALEVEGRDPYGLTAIAAVEGARRAMDPASPRGVIAPSRLVDPASFLNGLPDCRVRWVRSPSRPSARNDTAPDV